jgi:integrase
LKLLRGIVLIPLAPHFFVWDRAESHILNVRYRLGWNLARKELQIMLRSREGNWHYRFKYRGREYTGNTGLVANERERRNAEKVAKAAKAAVIASRLAPPECPEKPFVDGAAEFVRWAETVEYRSKPGTWQRIRVSFVSLCVHFQSEHVSAIGAGEIEGYKDWRLNTTRVKEITLRHDLHALSLFFQYAQKQKWVPKLHNPVREVSIPSDKDATREHVLTPAEEKAYFDRAKDVQDRDGRRNIYDLGRLMLQQGCRPEELMVLKKQHVNIEKRQVLIVAGKTKAARRTLNLTDESIAILRPRVDSGDTDWVFPSDRKPGRPIAKLQGPHDRVCRESEVSFVIYDLRHTFATRMIDAGANLPTLAAILGHSNLRTISRYVHPSAESQREAMEKYDAAQNRLRLRAV